MNVFVKYRILLVIENSRSYTGIGTFVYEYLGYEQDRDPDSRFKHNSTPRIFQHTHITQKLP